MDDWHALKKLQCQAPSETGIAQVHRIIGRNSGANLACGITEFMPGSIDMEVSQPEVFVVLDGALSINSNDTAMELAKNEALWMPSGSALQISVSEPTRVVYIILEKG
jgi:ethanolamine utilization protein EutQ (cupin superfamily)